jgi:hypothetical protein
MDHCSSARRARLGSGQSAPLGVQAHQGCGTWPASSSHVGTRSVPTGVHASVLAGIPLAVPQPDPAGNATPGRSPRRPPPAATRTRSRQIGTPVTRAVRCPEHGMTDAPRRSPECSPLSGRQGTGPRHRTMRYRPQLQGQPHRTRQPDVDDDGRLRDLAGTSLTRRPSLVGRTLGRRGRQLLGDDWMAGHNLSEGDGE